MQVEVEDAGLNRVLIGDRKLVAAGLERVTPTPGSLRPRTSVE